MQIEVTRRDGKKSKSVRVSRQAKPGNEKIRKKNIQTTQFILKLYSRAQVFWTLECEQEVCIRNY